MAKTLSTIDDLSFDKLNFNKHSDEGMKLLDKSIAENKFGRSVLADKNGNLIAGNGVVEVAKNRGGAKIKVIETTGDELVVVQRTDLDIDSKEGRSLAAMDNSVGAKNLKWNIDALKKVADSLNLGKKGWSDMGIPPRVLSKIFAEKIKPVVDYDNNGIMYKASESAPANLSDCIELSAYNDIVLRIESNEGISDADKAVLKLCAARFININFQNMAEYFCVSCPEMQKAMKDCLLVIVDKGKLMEMSLMEITQKMKDLFFKEVENV